MLYVRYRTEYELVALGLGNAELLNIRFAGTPSVHDVAWHVTGFGGPPAED